MKLASNDEEYLLLELLPNVANTFLRKRRKEEFEAKKASEPKSSATAEEKTDAKAPVTGPTLKAPMGGRVLEIKVKAGDEIKRGQTVIVYEAMKMENDIAADRAGKVKRVLVSVDDVIGTDQPLIEFE